MKQKSKSHKKNSGGRKTRGGAGLSVQEFITAYNAILDKLIEENKNATSPNPDFESKMAIFRAVFANYDDNLDQTKVEAVSTFADLPKVSATQKYDDYKDLFQNLAKDKDISDSNPVNANVKKAYNDIMDDKILAGGNVGKLP